MNTNVLASAFMRPEFEYFLELTQTPNITKTAERIGVQQAGLSKALKRLEDSVGTQLFIRKKSGLQLTEAGQKLRASLLHVTQVWEQKWNIDSAEEQQIVHGHYRLGCHPSIAIDSLPTFAPNLLSQNPHLQMSFTFAPSLEITRRVNALELDFGLVINPVKSPELVMKKLAPQFVSLWSSKTTTEPKTIFYHPDMLFARRVIRKYSKARLVAVPDYEVIGALLVEGGACGLLPNVIAERSGKLKQVSKPIFSVDLALIYNKEKQTSKGARVVIAAIEKAYKK